VFWRHTLLLCEAHRLLYHSTLGLRVIKRRRRPCGCLWRPRVRWQGLLSRVRGLEQLLHRSVQRFRGGLVFKAHRLLYHSTLGLSVIKKKKKVRGFGVWGLILGGYGLGCWVWWLGFTTVTCTEAGLSQGGRWTLILAGVAPTSKPFDESTRERIFFELMTSDHKLKAS